MDYKFYIGIDEVGRGPIAGPVTLCAVVSFIGRTPEEFKNIKDSKQLTEKKREEWFKIMKEAKKRGEIDFTIFSGTNDSIDKIGIVRTMNACIKKCLETLLSKEKHLEVQPPSKNYKEEDVYVLLDGGLRAPANFKNQETITKGDEKEVLIGMASVAAKVSRDWYMVEMAKKFPEYGFEKHKGYGTKAHYEAIKKHGASLLHRKSWL